jgi:hypothetical protein
LLSLTALIGVGVIGAIQVKKLVLYPLTKEKVEFRKKWLQERLQEAAADDSYYAQNATTAATTTTTNANFQIDFGW